MVWLYAESMETQGKTKWAKVSDSVSCAPGASKTPFKTEYRSGFLELCINDQHKYKFKAQAVTFFPEGY